MVLAADDHNVPLRAAFWLYDGERDAWILILEAERRAALDLLLEDAALFTQPHPVAERLRPVLGRAKSVLLTRMRNTFVGGYIVEGAVLYRLERSQVMTRGRRVHRSRRLAR